MVAGENSRYLVLSGTTQFAISTCTARYEWYIPVRQVAGTRTARYPVVSPKIDRRRPIKGEIDRRRSIEREIDRWRSIEGEEGKKKKRKRRKKEKRSTYFPVPSLPARRRCPRLASARAPSPPVGRGRFFSHARRQNVSPRGEKGRGDVKIAILGLTSFY
ncbi:hypothetical protein BHM03_00044861 [Ensete ventricosum]|nr:hypothetical protein BHM03_00044861 [Ensete ventricosum]